MKSVRSLNCRTCKIASGVRSLNYVGPGTASHFPPCEASSARFGVILRAVSDGDDETGRWARA
eukprot:1505565-Alexandrium_andersonii.AAC.1